MSVLPGAKDSQTVACVAVSPEGNVRYWPNISHDAAFVEVNAGLQGQEAAKIVSNAVSSTDFGAQVPFCRNQ